MVSFFIRREWKKTPLDGLMRPYSPRFTVEGCADAAGVAKGLVPALSDDCREAKDWSRVCDISEPLARAGLI